MKNLGFAVAAGAGLLIVGGGAWVASRKQGGGIDMETVATEQPTILDVLNMENVTEALDYPQPTTNSPRGIRNNNPLNIELGEPWQGLRAEQTDGRFAQFVDPRYGYRAAAKILASYRRRGVNTIRGIIGTWAPATENNVEAYIQSVAKRSGISTLQIVGREHYPELFEAMTWHENGQQPYAMALIAEGVSWA